MQVDLAVGEAAHPHEGGDRVGSLGRPGLPRPEQLDGASERELPTHPEYDELIDRIDRESEPRDRSEGAAPAAADCPEQVGIALRVGFDDRALRIDELQPLQAVAG